MELTNNVNIKEIKPLISPDDLKKEFPLPEAQAQTILEARHTIERIIRREDKRLAVIVGPCSVHDRKAVLEYAHRLKDLQEEIGSGAMLVMRAYFEKPRTSIGWKGLLYDPRLDESDDIEEGFRQARGILLEIAKLGLPAATEVLDPIVPQYLADMITWASIGARTAASQVHRQMASGFSMPIGFKNSTDGDLSIAIEGIKAARNPHAFLGITHDGRTGIATTRGNQYGHLVLRGGASGPNYQSEYVAFAEVLLQKSGIQNGMVVDCSHANCRKDFRKQPAVFNEVLQQVLHGNQSICGVMLESFLEGGSQPLNKPKDQLQYGLSVTDPCLGWNDTADLIRTLAKESVKLNQ